MDKEEFRRRVERLQEINEAIAGLDENIREAAFGTLKAYATGIESVGLPDAGTNGTDEQGTQDLDRDNFFVQHHKSDDKPADNALLAAGWHYTEYGTTPFSLYDIRTIADEVGLTIPTRPNMTFRNASYEGKSCFTQAGRGFYKPTVHGERRLKDTYQIRKGTKKKPSKDES